MTISSFTAMDIDKSRCTSSREPSRFFWVDYEQGKSQKRVLDRSKHAFLKSKHYEAQRNKKSQALRSSRQIPSPCDPRLLNGNVAELAKNDDLEDSTKTSRKPGISNSSSAFSSELLLLPRPTIRIVGDLPSSPNCRADNPDIYFHHYRLRTSKSCWPIAFHGMSTWLWQKTHDHPALGHVILSTSASQLAATLRLQNASPTAISNATKDACAFRWRAIKLLQQMLAPTPPSLESTILVVAHLACIEAAEANIVAVEAHMHGLKKLVDMAGGLAMLANQTIFTLYCCEVMRGAIASPQPVFIFSRAWEAKVLSQSAILVADNDSTKHSSLGARLFDSPWSRKIHPDLKSTLQALQKLINYYEDHLSGDFARHYNPIVNDYLNVLILRLYSPVGECSHMAFQESLRLSTIVYCLSRICSHQGSPSLAIMVDRLRQSLDHSYLDLHVMAPDLLFWILFMGGLASNKPLVSSQAWFVEPLAVLADELSLAHWHSAVQVLQGYFFFPRASDREAKSLWESVLETRRIKTVCASTTSNPL